MNTAELKQMKGHVQDALRSGDTRIKSIATVCEWLIQQLERIDPPPLGEREQNRQTMLDRWF